MTKELKQEFTLRITHANKTQLITILYEMILLYLAEAKETLSDEDKTEYKNAIRKIRGCMDELITSLHIEYALAKNLLQLYLYINRELVQASMHYRQENLEHVEFIIKKLHTAWKQIETQDMSDPIMGNTQIVYAGLTYGRNTLTENMSNLKENRGFSI
ncbi:MAG: flagellar export chaperone FliS [Lachnospiraceae bacterium]|nr:flagellar export chaperone FliS [Lachnospiraceae bacterium]